MPSKASFIKYDFLYKIEKMNPLILTYDIGTQSARGMLVNKKGETKALEQTIYKQAYYSKSKDWAEQRPDFYYEVICELTKNLKKHNAKLFSDIIAVTITVFRDSTICLDENNEPLRDMILWLDKREIDDDELPIPKINKLIFKIGGAIDTANMQHNQSACNYIMSREKEIWNKTKKYVVLSTYLNYKLTGNLIDSIANQIAHLPFDYKHTKWASGFDIRRCLYNVPKDKLCALCEPGSIIGEISEQCAKDSNIPCGLPLIATGSDKGCETIGLSVTSKTKAAVSFGTSATIQFSTPNYFDAQKYCPSYPSPVKGLYNPEYQVYRGFWMLTWFKNNFVSEEDIKAAKKLNISVERYFDLHLKEVRAGCDGLLLEPHWGAGVANPNAKGAIIGFSDVQSKHHIYRSIIEGINYDLMYGLELMSKRSGQKIKELYVGGGGAKSDEVCQICADMLGLTVNRIQTHEACGLGSSIIGFVSMGEYKDINEAINKMIRVEDVFVPDGKTHEFYARIYKDVYKKMPKNLEKYYVKTKKILRGDK